MNQRDALKMFGDEVLRWNESINLVSRQNSAVRVSRLVDQCRDALVAWTGRDGILGADLEGRDVLYVDLGSGGGFPAVIWHEMLVPSAGALRTILVEPRDKRAWFLERVARGLTAPQPAVHACRWSALEKPRASSPDRVIISLKALRLTDNEVLEGLAPLLKASSAADVSVARFHPKDEIWSPGLVAALGIPDPETEVSGEDWGAHAVAAGLVPAGEVNLVVSRYRYRRQ